MFKEFKAIEEKTKKQVKFLEIAENKSKRLSELRKIDELKTHLKHVETRLEILEYLKYGGQEKMVADDEEEEVVNVSEWCELIDEPLARFDGFIGKLKKELSTASDKERVQARWKEDLIHEERFQKRIEEEMKIEEMKMEVK